jgi:hypothetical protein
MLECYSFTSSSLYCKFMFHRQFVSSLSFSFWIDLWENDIVFWVNDVNCRFWVNRRIIIFLFSNNSWFSESDRLTTLWKEEIDDDDDILLRNVIYRSNLLTFLISWISILERIFNSCQKARFSVLFSVWMICKSYFCSLNWFRTNRKIFHLCDFNWICSLM